MANASKPQSTRRYNVLSPEQRAEIVRRYLAGERDVDLAREFGVSRAIPRQSSITAGYDPRLRKRRKALREDAFAEITPESAYWTGMLLSDGSILERRRSVRLGLAAEDGAHILKFQAFLGSEGKIIVQKRGAWEGHGNRQDLHSLTVSCPRM